MTIFLFPAKFIFLASLLWPGLPRSLLKKARGIQSCFCRLSKQEASLIRPLPQLLIAATQYHCWRQFLHSFTLCSDGPQAGPDPGFSGYLKDDSPTPHTELCSAKVCHRGCLPSSVLTRGPQARWLCQSGWVLGDLALESCDANTSLTATFPPLG